MICPIMSAGYGVSDEAVQIYCDEGECKWWDKGNKQCYFVTGIDMLEKIAKALEGIKAGVAR